MDMSDFKKFNHIDNNILSRLKYYIYLLSNRNSCFKEFFDFFSKK